MKNKIDNFITGIRRWMTVKIFQAGMYLVILSASVDPETSGLCMNEFISGFIKEK